MSDVHKTIAAVWRMESARLIAGLARMVRDVGLAEELAQDALVTALEKWPQTGVGVKQNRARRAPPGSAAFLFFWQADFGPRVGRER